MRPKRPTGCRKRTVPNGAVGAGTVGPDFGLHVCFGAAAILAVLLNEMVLALWPLRCDSAASILAVQVQTPVPAKACQDLLATQARTPAVTKPPPVVPLTPPPEAKHWADLTNPLQRVLPASLRLLPGAGPEGEAAAQVRRWLTFGMSSVRRPRVEYLGITLSRLFNALGNEEGTAIVVHLADFNEGWVARTSKWLGAGFADEVEAGRLHAIHAPQLLYPLQQAKLAVVRLSGFTSQELNQPFLKRDGSRVNGRETYWSASGSFFIYWCQSEGSAVSHRRWGVAATSDTQRVWSGTCPAYARAPEDHEVLDPLVTGWEEWDGKSWALRSEAGVDRLDVEAGELLKFGDSPQRQWWRSKQNLDYAFLMWYSAGISEYYMQLEDDVQVVPNFLPTVRSYIDRNLIGQKWVMVSFSKLGFIGKFFNATRLPQLAEFLLTFNAEMPCDWLVWVWIDILTSEPFTVDIPQDLEKEWEMRQVAIYNETVLKKLPGMRDDLQLYYKASVYAQNSGPKTGLTHGGLTLLGSEEAPVQSYKPLLDVNGAQKLNSDPPAKVRSTMAAWERYDASRAYPPGDPLGFWTSDTCWRREAPGSNDPTCDARSKFLEIAFNEPLNLRSIRIQMGGPEHPEDYLRNGKLLASPPGCAPTTFTELGSVSSDEQTFDASLPYKVGCIRLVLAAPQEAWVLVRGVWVEQAVPAPQKAALAGPTGEWTPAMAVEASTDSTASDEDVQHARFLAGTSGLPGPSATVAQPGSKSDVANSAAAAGVAVEAGAADAATGASAGSISARLAVSANDSGAVLSAFLAALIGILAGVIGWLAVCAGSQLCLAGMQTVGTFTCWLLTFMISLDVLFLLLLTPPSLSTTVKAASQHGPETQPCPRAGPAPDNVTVTHPAVQTLAPGHDWRMLLPGIHRVVAAEWGATKAASSLEGSTPAAVGSEGNAAKKWLAISLVAEISRGPSAVAEAVLRIADVGGGAIAVVLLVAGGCAGHSEGERAEFVGLLQQRLAGARSVHLLNPPAHLYPPLPMRTENLDLALLAKYSMPLADLYLHLEPDAVLLPDFVSNMKDYLEHLTKIPWIMVLLSKLGFTRKLLLARLLPRWAEFLVMFPEVSADTLIWDFIDVVGNETAPKAIYLATDATKRKRPDVILQYHKAEALIEHLGDVSSLEGKVQRHHEDYFKKHTLVDTLFDNPVAKVRTNLQGKYDMLQAVYDGSTPATKITCGGHTAPNCAACPQGHGAAWCNVDCMWVNGACVSIFKTDTTLSVAGPNGPLEGYVELVFEKPRDVEVFNIRMGGSVSAPKKADSARKFNMPDPDFDHALDDAELLFGHGEAPRGAPDTSACEAYDHIDGATGREVFWRSPQSRPATNVRCIRVAIRRAQQRPLIIRGLHIRSAHRLATSKRKKPLALPGPASHAKHAAQPVLRGAMSAAVDSATGARDPQLSPGGSAAEPLRRELESWSEVHFAWVLLVSVALVSGALAGVLGCVARAWTQKPVPRRGHSRRA